MIFKKYVLFTMALMASVYASDFNNHDHSLDSSLNQSVKKRKFYKDENPFESQLKHPKYDTEKTEKRINPTFSLTLPTERVFINEQNVGGIAGDVWPAIFSYMKIDGIINVAFSAKDMMSFVYSCIVPKELDLNKDLYKMGNRKLDELLIAHKINPIKLYEQVIGHVLDSNLPNYKINSKFLQTQEAKDRIESNKKKDLKNYPVVPGNVLRNAVLWQLLLNSFENTYCQPKETKKGTMIDDTGFPKDKTVFDLKALILPTVSLPSSLRFYSKAMDDRARIMSYLTEQVSRYKFLRDQEEYVPSILYWGGLCASYAFHHVDDLITSGLWFGGSDDLSFVGSIINSVMCSAGVDCSRRVRKHENYALELHKSGLLSFVLKNSEGAEEIVGDHCISIKSLQNNAGGYEYLLKSNFLSFDTEKVLSASDLFKLALKTRKEELKKSKKQYKYQRQIDNNNHAQLTSSSLMASSSSALPTTSSSALTGLITSIQLPSQNSYVTLCATQPITSSSTSTGSVGQVLQNYPQRYSLSFSQLPTTSSSTSTGGIGQIAQNPETLYVVPLFNQPITPGSIMRLGQTTLHLTPISSNPIKINSSQQYYAALIANKPIESDSTSTSTNQVEIDPIKNYTAFISNRPVLPKIQTKKHIYYPLYRTVFPAVHINNQQFYLSFFSIQKVPNLTQRSTNQVSQNTQKP